MRINHFYRLHLELLPCYFATPYIEVVLFSSFLHLCLSHDSYRFDFELLLDYLWTPLFGFVLISRFFRLMTCPCDSLGINGIVHF